MRALVLKGFGEMVVETRPDPVPGPGQVLIARQVPLNEAPQAFVDLARPDGTPGKVLVRLDR